MWEYFDSFMLEQFGNTWRFAATDDEKIFIVLVALLLPLFVALAILYTLILVPYWRYYPPFLLAKYRHSLAAHSHYYRHLAPAQRRRFERRVQRFINTRRFIARGKNFKLRDEMKARIAGAAVELTFGFRQFDFEHFTKILVYPNSYYSNITKKYHQGEVNPRGFLVLSWQAFEQGYSDPEDGVNLGVHELAHAMKLENKIQNANFRFFNASAIHALESYYQQHLASLRAGSDLLLRPYAAVNLHEFFAVCCENFLERPQAFMKHHPALYAIMRELLRQDPLALQATAPSKGPILAR